MDTPSDFLDPRDSARLQKVLQQLTDFIASYETIEQKLEIREQGLEALLTECEQNIRNSMGKIQDVLAHYESVMSETGAARFRVTAEKLLKEGQEHQTRLQTLTQKAIENIQQENEKVSVSVRAATQHFKDALDAVNLLEFKETARQAYSLIEELGREVIQRVNKMTRGFLVKNLLSMAVIAIIIVVFTTQYITNEWPWESHQRATHERELGNDILENWGTMDDSVKKYLQTQVFKSEVLK